MLDLLTSKNWKDRVQFYQSYTWPNNDTEILSLISKESIIPALEHSIKCLLTCPFLNFENTKNILKYISNKNLKELFKEYFTKLHKNEELINDMIEFIKTSKNSKTVFCYVEFINYLTENFNIKYDYGILNDILKSSDPNVRKEGIELCIVLYDKIGNEVFEYLKDVKEIQMKEINEKIEIYENERKIVHLEVKKNDENEINPNNFSINFENKKNIMSDIQNTKSKFQILMDNSKFLLDRKGTIEIPENVVNNLSSNNYKERLSAFQNIIKYPYRLNNEAIKQITLKINDFNLQVSQSAIECLNLIKISKEIQKILFERLKEKKLKEHIFVVLKNKKIDSFDFKLSEIKNPVMKSSILEYFKDVEIEDEFVVDEIIKATEDGNSEVRKNAFECCRKFKERFREKLGHKIIEYINKKIDDKKNNIEKK